MNTAIRLTNAQSSERHKHGYRLARLANKLAHHANEFNEKRAELRPFANRVKHALEQYNDALDDANAFLASIGCDHIVLQKCTIAIPGEIEYDNDVLDSACEVLSDLGMEE